MPLSEQIPLLLRTNGFSEEAIAFIMYGGGGIKQAFLPLLATLANASAKEYDAYFYTVKSALLDEIEGIACLMGWRTFVHVDESVPDYPYIYYVDGEGFPQVSFHCENPRATTWRGKWSGIPNQQDARILLANQLKKAGFKGMMWDFNTLTKKLMLAKDVVQACHLHKGKNYTFTIEYGELCITVDGVPVHENETAVMQSFMTRLSKIKEALPADGESSNEGIEGAKSETNHSGANASPQQNEGNAADCGEETDAASDENPSSDNADGKGSDSPSLQEAGGNDGGQEQAEDTGNEGSNAHQNGIVGNDLAQAEEVGISELELVTDTPQSCTEQDCTCAPQEEATTQPNGFFKLLESTKELHPDHTYGGGATLNTKKGGKNYRLIANALVRISNMRMFAGREFGFDNLDKRKVVKAIATNPTKILRAKYSRPFEKIIFSVDTSASVSEFGQFILDMIASAKTSDNISVFSGGEAFPIINEKTGKNIAKAKGRRDCFYDAFHNLVDTYAPALGTTIVFWGDALMLLRARNIVSLKKLASKYRCIWLYPYDNKQVAALREEQKVLYNNPNANLDYMGILSIIDADFEVIYNVKSPETLLNGLKSIIL